MATADEAVKKNDTERAAPPAQGSPPISRRTTIERHWRMLRHITDVLTIITLAVGLFATFYQIRGLSANLEIANKSVLASNKSTDRATWNAVIQQWLELDKTLVDKPWLRPYLYGNIPVPPGDKERQDVLAMGGYVMDFMDNALIIGNLINNEEINWLREWKQSFISMFQSSPVLCGIYHNYPNEYSQFTIELAHEHCGEPSAALNLTVPAPGSREPLIAK